MARGKVRWFDNKKGYGFIELEDGQGDIFVHYSDIGGGGFKSLEEGDVVEFDVENTDKGQKAINVVKVE